jgi:DinB family protein
MAHRLLSHARAGEPRDALLRLQYPVGMPLPATLGNWDALSPEEQERLELAVAGVNQSYVNAHRGDTLELLAAEFLAARQDTLDLLRQFTDERLATAVPTVGGDRTAGDLFAGRAAHAAEHMTWIVEGLRQGV